MRKLRIVQNRWWSVISKGVRRKKSWVVCKSSISSSFQGRFFYVLMRDIKGTNFSFGCAIAEAVSHWLPTFAAWV
jgi:hypothetical protein